MHLIVGMVRCSFGYPEKRRVWPDTPFGVAFHKCALITSMGICVQIFCPCLPIKNYNFGTSTCIAQIHIERTIGGDDPDTGRCFDGWSGREGMRNGGGYSLVHFTCQVSVCMFFFHVVDKDLDEWMCSFFDR
mgnify:CR=1 FL=1